MSRKKGMSILSIALWVGFTVMVFIAAPSARAQEQLEVFPWWNSDDLFQQIFENFERDHPNVDVTEVASSGAQYDSILTLVAAGTPPDVVIMPLGFYMPLAGAGVLDDITPLMETDAGFQEIRSDLFTNILEEFVTPDGALFAFPVDINLRMLFYNRDHFDQAGLAYPTNEWDFDQFVETARELTAVDNAGNVTRWGFEGFAGPPSAWVTWIRAGGGRLVDRSVDPTRTLMSEPAARRALQRLVDMINVYQAAPANGVSFGSQMPSMGLPWIEQSFNYEDIEGLDYAMVRQPSGEERYSAMGVRLVGVVKGSEETRLAYEFAKYMSTNPEAQTTLGIRKVSWVRSVATDPDILDTPANRNKRSVIEAIPYAEPIYPLTAHWNEIAPVLQEHVHAALRGEVAVESATAEIDRIVPTILQGE